MVHNPSTQTREAADNYLRQKGEVQCGGAELTGAETNFHCSDADGWTKGTLFYPINFLFLDPPNY